MPLRYTVMRSDDAPVIGEGETVNISRTGLLFRAEGGLQTGDSIVMMLDWPVQGKGNAPLKLLITGLVIRVRRPLAAITIYSHRLLAEQDVANQPEAFWPMADLPERSHLQPVALVEEGDNVADLVSAVLKPQGWLILRAEAIKAKAVLTRGKPTIALLVTRTPSLLDRLPVGTPAILTLEESAPEEATGNISGIPNRVAIRRPLTDVGLRLLVGILCGGAAVSGLHGGGVQ